MKKSRSGMACWRRFAAAILISVSVMAGLAFTEVSSAGGSVDRAAAEASTHALRGASNCAKGAAPGITAGTVRLAVTVVNISGGSLTDATVGIPTAPEQEKDWTLVANSINKAGGAGCRKLQLSFYDVNPIDAAGAQQTCLTIANSHPYMVLDVGALSEVNASNCIPAAKVPFVSNTLTPDQLTKYFPYYLEVGGVPTDALRNGILGLNQLGYFKASKGFKKLGVLYDTCNPALIAADRAALKQAGVPAAKTVYFNLGCPAGEVFSSAAVEQAVLSFKNSGVTDVTDVGGPTVTFTQQAALQNYKPIYVLTDDTVGEETLTGSNAPNPTNLNGAINIGATAYGEQTTPGFKPSSATKKCNAIFAAANLPSVYVQSDAYGGVACNYLWYVQALLNHATTVQQSKLPSSLHNVGTVNFSYPSAPVNFTAAPKDVPYGTSLWRAEIFVASCKCWHVPDPTFNPPFK
jgi:hypothetical protein